MKLLLEIVFGGVFYYVAAIWIYSLWKMKIDD